MSFVYAKPGENIESLLRRFKRKVEASGIMSDYRKHEFYTKPSVLKKEKSAEARKRERKRQQLADKFYKSNANFKFSKDKSTKIYPSNNKGKFVKPAGPARPYQARQDNRPTGNRSDTRNDQRPYQNERRYNNSNSGTNSNYRGNNNNRNNGK